MSKSFNAELLFDGRYSVGLGCSACADRLICGGLNTRSLFDCWPLCCNTPAKCDYACPRDAAKFVEHMISIRGFEFDDIPISQVQKQVDLPASVPMVFSKSANRRVTLDSEYIAVPLVQTIDLRTGKPRFNSRQHFSELFGVNPSAKIILSGVMEDVPLERYWFARNREFIDAIKELGPVLVTSPNFSSFSNAPRWDNLFNLKRIAICWSEFAEAGIPTSLHMNARTPHDWKRWTDFINVHDEIQSISFEFATVSSTRKSWYVDRLMELAANTTTILHLAIRGGNGFLSRLREGFNLTVIDTNSFIKSAKRQLIQPGKRSVSAASHDEYHIDQLLEHNVQMQSIIIGHEISG